MKRTLVQHVGKYRTTYLNLSVALLPNLDERVHVFVVASV